MLIGNDLREAILDSIEDYSFSKLKPLVDQHGMYVIKFVQSQWARHYTTPKPLKVSETPALTWGTATYVTPLAFPLSSALYGRIGLVTSYDPGNWKIFDATDPYRRMLYIKWVEAQPAFEELVTSVHSTIANHTFRNKFRQDFKIDCVMFHPDQEAEYHTDMQQHIWLAVTDWQSNGIIENGMSSRLNNARFTVLIDEDFLLKEQKWDLPVKKSSRQIEAATEILHAARSTYPIGISSAHTSNRISAEISDRYNHGGYLHIFIEP
jgi:hypothetical protein